MKNFVYASQKSETVYTYYQEALIKLQIKSLITEGHIEQAINVLIGAHVKNPFLIYTVEITEIRDYLENKLRIPGFISLEELCYVFIDDSFEKERQACFLNYLETNMFNDPLDILIHNQLEEIIYYYLDKICSIEMLNTIYKIFDTSDEAKDYRIEICKYLVGQKYNVKKNQAEMRH